MTRDPTALEIRHHVRAVGRRRRIGAAAVFVLAFSAGAELRLPTGLTIQVIRTQAVLTDALARYENRVAPYHRRRAADAGEFHLPAYAFAAGKLRGKLTRGG